MDEGWAVIVAAVMATLGIMYSSRQQRKLLRRQHTYQAIERHNRWAEFDQNLESVRKLIDAGDMPDPSDENRADDWQAIDFILNYYEFLSAAIWCGDIDERLVFETENARLCRIVEKLGNYIRANHAMRGDSTMWENLLELADRWLKFPRGHGDAFRWAVETLWGRPLRSEDYRSFWKSA